MKRNLLIFTIFYICQYSFFANNSHAQAYNWREYTARDGLIKSQISCLFQDTRGYIWIGTMAGLSRYDGVNFYTVPIKVNSRVHSIKQDKEENVWILSTKGLYKYTYSISPFIEDTLIEYQNSDLLFNGGFTIDNNNDIWLIDSKINTHIFVFRDGIYHRASQFVAGIDSLKTSSLFYDTTTERLWIGTVDEGLYFIEKNRLFHFSDKPTLIFSISRNFENKLIVVTSKGICSIEDGKCSEYFFISNFSSFLQLSYAPKYKHLYYFNHKAIVYRYNVETKDSINFSINGIKSNSLLLDNENNLWIGYHTGLNRLLSTAFINYTPQNSGINSYVYCAVEDAEKKIWFASYDSPQKLVRFDGNKFTWIKTYYDVFKGAFYPCATRDSKNNLLFPNDKGVLKYDGTKFSMIKDLKSTYHFYIYKDTTEEKHYFGTKRGFSVIDKYEKVTTYNSETTGDTLPNILAIEKDKLGRIWLCHSTEIVLFNGSEFTHPDSVVRNGCSGARAIYKDYNNNLWIGGNGLWFYDYKKFYPIAGEYIFQDVSFIKPLNKHQLLAGAADKMFMIDLEKFYSNNAIPLTQPAKVHFRMFNQDNGFVGNDCQQNGTCVTDDGIAWIPMADCVVRMDTNELTPEKLTNEINLQARYLNKNGDLSFVKNAEFNDGRIILQSNQNNIQIDFNLISFSYSSRIRYQHRLIGYLPNWSKPSRVKSISYTKLPPGKYTFEIIATLDGTDEKKTAQLEFLILPRFWQTWWFKLILGLIVVFLLYVAYKLRLQHLTNKLLKQQQQELALINSKIEGQEEQRRYTAKELHDGVGGSLTGLKLNLENLKSKYEQPLIINEIIEQVNDVHQEVRNISYNLDAPLFTNTNIEEAIRARILRFTERHTINVDFYCDQEINWAEIDVKLQRELYRIVQEAFSNIVKHAQASQIEVQIMKNENLINLSVDDNGKGFNPTQIARGLGLKNIEERVKSLNGKVNIESTIGNGTSIMVEVPIIKIIA